MKINVSHNLLLEKNTYLSYFILTYLLFYSYLSPYLISIYTTRIMTLLRAYLRLKKEHIKFVLIVLHQKF